MPKPGAITINIDGDGPKLESGACTIKLASDVCIKGLQLEFREGDGVVFEDNCIEFVPGEIVSLDAKGLRLDDQGKLSVKCLSMSDCC